MLTPRYAATATLLSNDKVLVISGLSGCCVVPSVELYDPRSSSWSLAASMTTLRYNPTATLLSNGKVLVTGSNESGTAGVPMAELYDPASDSWSDGGLMHYPGIYQTATLLFSGKVLVTGGYEGVSDVHSQAEVYDPTSNTWAPVASMTQGRVYQTATLLGNGSVLVTGGSDNLYTGHPLSSAEIYDPTTDSWLSAGSMATARYGAAATILSNGKVLVTGGYNVSATSGVLSSAEVYNPARNTWSSAGSMNSVRAFHTATLLSSGKVLVIGGDGSGYADPDLYENRVGNPWSTTDSMITPRINQTATMLSGGKVLVAGGYTSSAILSSAELFDESKRGRRR